MCGIAGIVSPGARVDPAACGLESALDRLAHRGPDDRGVWTNGAEVALGHRRLTILDLSARGHQPIVSPDGRYVMTFNGEVYNFADIRTELEACGHAFEGTGDTPVVLAALQQWGPGALDRFVGMFAIALWDEHERTLMLARDRMGIKPLYYGWDGTTLWFGSEMKALRAFSHWRPQIDVNAAAEYFQYGYIAAPRTIFRDAYKLEPGCWLQLRAGSGPERTRYWSIPGGEMPGADPAAAGDDTECEERLEALLVDACRYRMVSDVPVGVYLSGGVDSSLVTALLSREGAGGGRLRTFTIGFEEDRNNEAPYAREVARHVGTDHTEYTLRIAEALEIARSWGDLFDEPFADSSGLPTLLVSRLAARDVKVVLSADGGDELFAGYRLYTHVLDSWHRFSRVPAWARAVARRGVRIPPRAVDVACRALRMSPTGRGLAARRVRRLRAVLDDGTCAGVFDGAVMRWLGDDVRALLGTFEPVRPSLADYPGTPVEKMCLWDAHQYLPDDILTKVDRTTMAASIEGREPLLDHRVVEFAFRLPPRMRRGEYGPKHVLKRILYRHVPRALVDRPKQGFEIPLEAWLRDGMHELVRHFLDEGRVRREGLLDPQVVAGVRDRFYGGDRSETFRLWSLLAFEMWRESWS